MVMDGEADTTLLIMDIDLHITLDTLAITLHITLDTLAITLHITLETLDITLHIMVRMGKEIPIVHQEEMLSLAPLLLEEDQLALERQAQLIEVHQLEELRTI